MTNNRHTKDFIVGATIGALLGTVTALLAAPKSGRRLRQSLSDLCCDIKEKTQDFSNQVSRKGKSLAKNASSQACDWSDCVKGMVCEEDNQETMKDLLLGGLTGGVIGAAAGLLMAPKAGTEFRQDIADTYQDISEKTHETAEQWTKQGKMAAKQVKNQASDWMNLAKQVLEQLTDNAQEKGEDVVSRGKEFLEEKGFNNIMEWASLGMRVWQHLKK